MVEVTQADRDAAAALQEAQAAWLGMDFVCSVHSEFLRQGSHDDDDGVQAFARARTEATAELVEALRAVVVVYKRDNPMRTADFHAASCTCMRCAVDLADTALAKHLTDGPGLTERLEN